VSESETVALALCATAAWVTFPTTRGRSRLAVVTQRASVPARAAQLTARDRVARLRRTAFGRVTAFVALLAAADVVGVRRVLVLTLAGGGGWLALDRAGKRRRMRATAAAVIEMCRAVAAELRAGQPAGAAFTAGATLLPEPSRQALAQAISAARQGAAAELSQLLIDAAAEPGLTGLRRLAACWSVAAGAGGALAPALDRIADGLQDEIDVGRDIATSLAAPRATVRLLAVLPVLGLLIGTLVGADPVGFLVGSPLGLCCLVAATVLDLAGLGWARRIAASAARLG
jgi:tight adherence protein B